MSDMIWRNTSTGGTTIFLMNTSGQVASTSFLGAIPSVFSVLQAGDFNGDGLLSQCE